MVSPVTATMSSTVITTPRIAVSNGMPAARNDPRVSQRTTRAISTPRASTMLKPGALLL